MQILFTFGLMILCFEKGQTQETSERIVTYSIQKPQQIHSGKIFKIDVLFSVKQGWYIYAPTGINAIQGMIGTKVIFKLPAGITRAEKIKLPEPIRKYGHEIYEGKNITMSQSLQVSPTLKPGNYEIKGKVTYQTCNSQICLPPRTDEINIMVEVLEIAVTIERNNNTVSLKFTALDGRKVNTEKLKGKIVLIDCWATWCVPCLKEIPHIIALYKKYHKQGFEVIGISMDEPVAKKRVLQIIKRNGIPWPQRFEGKGFQEDSFRKQLEISSLPTAYLLNKEGRIVDSNARGKRLEPLIKQYLEL